MPEAGKPYKLFTQREKHPDYKAPYWAKCRALYSGRFLEQEQSKILSELLPKRNAEEPADYDARKKQAVYKNYAGPIVDKKVGDLFIETPSMGVPEDAPEPPEFYAEWFKDVSRPGGQEMSFNDLLHQQMLTAQVCQRAWTLVDLPQTPADIQPESEGDQERMGLLQAYACPIEPESVWDWKRNDEGELQWILLAFQRRERDSLDGDRDVIEEEFVYFDKAGFARYRIRYDKNRPPMGDEIVPLVESGQHSFGRVPVCVLELTPGMHTMGKLENLARAHLNLTSALQWATISSLFPTRVAFMGPEDESVSVTSDPNRGTDQKVSQIHAQVLGAQDRYEFIGPSPEPFAQAARQADGLRDEMYRVAYQGSDSTDGSAAALGRSGLSKQMDRASQGEEGKALMQLIHKHAKEILACVGEGRGDKGQDGKPIPWVMTGAEETPTVDKAGELQEAQMVQLLDINSPSFQVDYKCKVAKAVVGDDVPPERLEVYRQELAQNNPPEKFAAERPMLEEAEAENPPPFPPKDDEEEEEVEAA